MRIGLVCPYSMARPGGVQNHVLGLAGSLVQRGHEVAVLAPGQLSAAAARRHGLRPDQFTGAGAAVPVPWNGSVARINFGPVTAARVRGWLRDTAPDVLHLHEPITPSVSVLALWAADVPVVATFHTATPRNRTLALAGSVLRSSVAKVDAGIAVSRTARQVVREHLRRDAVVIGNGLDVADFAGPRLPAIGSGPRLTFLGRLDEPRKGLAVLLQAWPRLRAALPGVSLTVAGPGDHPLPEGVRRAGLLTDDERRSLLLATDVFVAPHVARESFGLVLAEAMAAGSAIACSDLPAFREVLGDGDQVLGDLFTPGDPDDLVRAVCAAASADPARTARARRQVARWDWSVITPRVLEVLHRAGRGATPAPFDIA